MPLKPPDRERAALRYSYQQMLKMPFSDKKFYRQQIERLDRMDAEEGRATEGRQESYMYDDVW